MFAVVAMEAMLNFTVMFGIGQRALVTLVFKVLVTAAPKELAGDVGSLRGTTQNLAAAVGTAVAGALMVGPPQRRRHAQSGRESPVCLAKFKRSSISTTSTSIATILPPVSAQLPSRRYPDQPGAAFVRGGKTHRQGTGQERDVHLTGYSPLPSLAAGLSYSLQEDVE